MAAGIQLPHPGIGAHAGGARAGAPGSPSRTHRTVSFGTPGSFGTPTSPRSAGLSPFKPPSIGAAGPPDHRGLRFDEAGGYSTPRGAAPNAAGAFVRRDLVSKAREQVEAAKEVAEGSEEEDSEEPLSAGATRPDGRPHGGALGPDGHKYARRRRITDEDSKRLQDVAASHDTGWVLRQQHDTVRQLTQERTPIPRVEDILKGISTEEAPDFCAYRRRPRGTLKTLRTFALTDRADGATTTGALVPYKEHKPRRPRADGRRPQTADPQEFLTPIPREELTRCLAPLRDDWSKPERIPDFDTVQTPLHVRKMMQRTGMFRFQQTAYERLWKSWTHTRRRRKREVQGKLNETRATHRSKQPITTDIRNLSQQMQMSMKLAFPNDIYDMARGKETPDGVQEAKEIAEGVGTGLLSGIKKPTAEAWDDFVIELTDEDKMLRSLAKGMEVPLIDAEMIYAEFKKFDEDGSGTMDAAEFKAMLIHMHGGMEPTPKQLELALGQIDADHSGDIDFPEFFCWYAQNYLSGFYA